jgi:hypothetical protein
MSFFRGREGIATATLEDRHRTRERSPGSRAKGMSLILRQVERDAAVGSTHTKNSVLDGSCRDGAQHERFSFLLATPVPFALTVSQGA